MLTKPNYITKLFNKETQIQQPTQETQTESINTQDQVKNARKEFASTLEKPVSISNQQSLKTASFLMNKIIDNNYNPNRSEAKFLRNFVNKCGVFEISQKMCFETILNSFDGNATTSPRQKAEFVKAQMTINNNKNLVLSKNLPTVESLLK